MPFTPVCPTTRAAGTVVALAVGFVCLSAPGRAQSGAGPASKGLARLAGKYLDDARDAGLAAAAESERLTWERIYTLAAARVVGRGKDPLLKESDPVSLAALARARGVGDFAGFRRAFLDPANTFAAPTFRAFELLHRLHAADEARQRVTQCEQFVEVIRGARSQALLDQARQKLSNELTRYRDALDALKVELGLAPQARVVLDPTLLAPFREVFDAADAWQKQPGRNPADLSRIAVRLPVLEDVVIGGQSLLTISLAQIDRPEDLLRAAASGISRTPGRDGADPARAARELRIHAAGRELIRTARAYEAERRRFVSALEQRNAVFERLIAPPSTSGPASAPLPVFDVDTRRREVLESRTRLVAFWCEYQAARVPLLRDLGDFPYADWPAFIKALGPRPGQE